MQYEMRRHEREMPPDDALKILESGEYGVLSMTGPDAMPYGVPISFVYHNGLIYMHCAKTGRKIDYLRYSPLVSFSVVEDVEAVYDGSFSTYYKSVIVSGSAELIGDEDEKREALTLLAGKYLPAHIEKAENAISKSMSGVCVIRVTPEKITGKSKPRT